MRKVIIIGNWKMHKTIKETVDFIHEIEENWEPLDLDCGIAAPFTALKDAVSAAKHLIIAAQNCHYEESGAYTGEVSIPMLKEVGITHCIVGHSERRQYYHETDESVNLKVKALLANDITPIICVGETLEQFEAQKTAQVVSHQVQKALEGLKEEDVKKLIIAYEPIWAIGTGKSATREIAQESCALIRKEVAKLYPDAAEDLRIQYGGSVKPENIQSYLAMPDIDGALVGGAALKVDSYRALIKGN